MAQEEEEEEEEEGVIRCICSYTHDDGFTIQCEKCLVWQHAVCVGIGKNSVPDRYYCEECEPRELDIEYAQTMQRKKIYKSGQNGGKESTGKVNRRGGNRLPQSSSVQDLGPMVMIAGHNLPSYQQRVQDDSDYYDELDDLAQDYVPMSSLAFQVPEIKNELLSLQLLSFHDDSENMQLDQKHANDIVGLRRRDNDIALVATAALSKGRVAQAFGQLVRQEMDYRPEKYVFNLHCNSSLRDDALVADYLLDCRRFGTEWRFIRYSETPNCVFVLEKNGNDEISVGVYLVEDVPKDVELSIQLPPGITSSDLPASHRSSLYHLDNPMLDNSNDMAHEEKEDEEIIRISRPDSPPPPIPPVLSQEERQNFEIQLREELHNFAINQGNSISGAGSALLMKKGKSSPFSFIPLPHEEPRRNLKAEWIRRWNEPVDMSVEDDISLCESSSESEDETENEELPPTLVEITYPVMPPLKRWLANSKTRSDPSTLTVKTELITSANSVSSITSAPVTQETISAVTTAANSPLVGVKRAATDEPPATATRISFMDYKKKRKLATSSSNVSLASTSDSATNNKDQESNDK